MPVAVTEALSSALSLIRGVPIDSRALLDKHIFDMVWLYHSPISVGRKGVFYSFKLFLPAVAVLRRRGGVSTLCSERTEIDDERRQLLAMNIIVNIEYDLNCIRMCTWIKICT
jgi:hypothetical protein